MRKRIVGVLAFCILMFLGMAGYLIFSGKTVQVGMSEIEVEELFGGQGLPLKFAAEEDLKNVARNLEMEAPAGATMKRWDRKHSSVHVVFDSDGKVAGVYYPRGVGRYFNVALRSVGLD